MPRRLLAPFTLCFIAKEKKRSIAPKQTRRILLLVLEVPADDQKLKEQKADGKKPYFFLTDYKHLPKLWVE